MLPELICAMSPIDACRVPALAGASRTQCRLLLFALLLHSTQRQLPTCFLFNQLMRVVCDVCCLPCRLLCLTMQTHHSSSTLPRSSQLMVSNEGFSSGLGDAEPQFG
jgi:hypothetical protein